MVWFRCHGILTSIPDMTTAQYLDHQGASRLASAVGSGNTTSRSLTFDCQESLHIRRPPMPNSEDPSLVRFYKILKLLIP